MAADDELVKGLSQAGEVICPFPGCRDEILLTDLKSPEASCGRPPAVNASTDSWLQLDWPSEGSGSSDCPHQMDENYRPRTLSPAKHSWAAENSLEN